MSWFTYADRIDDEHLRQGDLLNITEELCSVLQQIHPHYLNPDYRYFVVLTQSCDLIRRDGRNCKAQYISLAAAKSFDLVLHSEASALQKEEFERKGRICRSNKKNALYQFIERVLNNNHGEFFYFHEDDQLRLSEPCCALLRMSIAIESSENYNKCLKAKVLELTDEFRAKLGWSVGNLYSRVGTKDWTDVRPKQEFAKLINDILDRQFVWYDPEIIDALKKDIKKNSIQISTLSEDKILELADSIHVPQKHEKILESIRKILTTSGVLREGVDIDNLLLKIGTDPRFKAFIK